MIDTSVIFVSLYFIFSVAGTNYTWFDTSTTAMSIMAMLLLSLHKIETWNYWIVVDVIYVAFFIYIGSWLSAVTFAIFFILAIIGRKKWNTEIKGL